MPSRSFLQTLATLFTAAVVAAYFNSPLVSAIETSRPSTTRPNIVVIIADDLGADDWGGAGNQVVRTPNLDRLASAGLTFKNAILTCSSCSPSRSSIITSRYPHNTDAEQLHWPLPASQVTFVELLRQAGYYTAAAGKWHLGEQIKGRLDKVIDASSDGFALPSGATADKSAVMEDKQDASGCGNWVRTLKDRPRDKPFFLWLAALDPHRDYSTNVIPVPHKPDAITVPPYLPDAPRVRSDLALYYDEITRLDGYVGRVLAELEAQQVAENTLVVFLSDNGRPFPRCKTTLYESGIRTPLIMRWPAQISANGQTHAVVSTVDLGVTLLEVAGLQPHQAMQGKSFVEVLGKPESAHRDFAFSEHNWHDYDAFERSVRSRRYKYIANLDATLPLTPPADAVRSPTFEVMRQLRDRRELSAAQLQCFVAPRGEEELYDLESDPHELQNLVGDPALAQVLAEHRAALETWRNETADFQGVRAPDEFDRESGKPLPRRQRPRPSKESLKAKAADSAR